MRENTTTKEDWEMKTYRVTWAIEIDVRADSEEAAIETAQQEMQDDLLGYVQDIQTGGAAPVSVVEIDE